MEFTLIIIAILLFLIDVNLSRIGDILANIRDKYIGINR